jgi:hypothetical protein
MYCRELITLRDKNTSIKENILSLCDSKYGTQYLSKTETSIVCMRTYSFRVKAIFCAIRLKRAEIAADDNDNDNV